MSLGSRKEKTVHDHHRKESHLESFSGLNKRRSKPVVHTKTYKKTKETISTTNRRGGVQMGKVQMELSDGGLRPLPATCAQLSAIVHI